MIFFCLAITFRDEQTYLSDILQNLGIHWGSAVPGFIALACFPFPILFYIYGARIRAKCKYAAVAAAQMPSGSTQEKGRMDEGQ